MTSAFFNSDQNISFNRMFIIVANKYDYLLQPKKKETTKKIQQNIKSIKILWNSVLVINDVGFFSEFLSNLTNLSILQKTLKYIYTKLYFILLKLSFKTCNRYHAMITTLYRTENKHLILGSNNLDNCSIERYVPIYLVVSGLAPLLFSGLSCQGKGDIETCCQLICGCFGFLFSFVWLICGKIPMPFFYLFKCLKFCCYIYLMYIVI